MNESYEIFFGTMLLMLVVTILFNTFNHELGHCIALGLAKHHLKYQKKLDLTLYVFKLLPSLSGKTVLGKTETDFFDYLSDPLNCNDDTRKWIRIIAVSGTAFTILPGIITLPIALFEGSSMLWLFWFIFLGIWACFNLIPWVWPEKGEKISDREWFINPKNFSYSKTSVEKVYLSIPLKILTIKIAKRKS